MLIGKPRSANISLAAFPRPANLDEYARASEEIEGLLSGLPGIVAVYQTGTVSVPGISDLDRIAVVEAEGRVPGVWSQLSDSSRYLAMHTPFLVDRATFRCHRWFANVEPLQFLFGSTVEVEDRPSPEYSEPLIGAESLVVCLLRVVKELWIGRLKVRPFLCGLNNLPHALALAGLGHADASTAWRLADDVARIRHTWFTSPEDQRAQVIHEVAVRAVPALSEALWALGERSECVDDVRRRVKLGAPWSNVALVSSRSPLTKVGPRTDKHLRLIRSARVSEVRWRLERFELPLHPAVVALLTGQSRPEHTGFRSARDELVRAYRKFLSTSGRDYSGLGLASPFVAS